MRRRGFTLIETLIAGLMMVLVGAGCWTLIRSSYNSQYQVLNENGSDTNARAAIDYVADHLRGAASLTSAAAGDVTVTDNTGSSLRYWRASDNTLRASVNGVPAAGTQILNNLTSLQFTYWSYSGGAWTSSGSPSTLSQVAAIDVAATATTNGFSRKVSSSVKLRQIRVNSAQGF